MNLVATCWNNLRAGSFSSNKNPGLSWRLKRLGRNNAFESDGGKLKVIAPRFVFLQTEHVTERDERKVSLSLSNTARKSARF